MSDERKECSTCIDWTPKTNIGYCVKSHTENVTGDDCCDAHKARAIQQKPKIDEKYVDEKARELFKWLVAKPRTIKDMLKWLTQIISDVKGINIKENKHETKTKLTHKE